ncbi:hypothetical protein [Vibrio owensii]|uniref:hypothetical protein n=1 Tax=Vibrio owensii TaxID=696485 RepID=UPI0018F11BB9|nr:hypothetical protein [Vibrio owensii]
MTTKHYNSHMDYVGALLVNDLLRQENPVIEDLCKMHGLNERPKFSRSMFHMIELKLKHQISLLSKNVSIEIYGSKYYKDGHQFFRDNCPIGIDNHEKLWECIEIELFKHEPFGIRVNEMALLNTQKRTLAVIHKELQANDRSSKFNWEETLNEQWWETKPTKVLNHRGEHMGDFYQVPLRHKNGTEVYLFNHERMFTVMNKEKPEFETSTFNSLIATRIHDRTSIYA